MQESTRLFIPLFLLSLFELHVARSSYKTRKPRSGRFLPARSFQQVSRQAPARLLTSDFEIRCSTFDIPAPSPAPLPPYNAVRESTLPARHMECDGYVAIMLRMMSRAEGAFETRHCEPGFFAL